MGKYRVVAGQNIYDVALHLYGSIEGVVDLLISNPDLSFATTLTAGRELVYTDDFVIRADVVAYNGLHGIVPANGERHVYPKTFTLPLAVVFTLDAGIITVQCAVSGAGQLEIDWGDDSDTETVLLADTPQPLTHTFDNKVRARRRIRWFTDARFRSIDWSGLKPRSLVLVQTLPVEELTLTHATLSLESLRLLSVGRSCTACRMPGTDDARPLRRPTETDSHRPLPDNPCGTLRRPAELHGHFTYAPDGDLPGAGPGCRNEALPYCLGHGSRMGHPT